MCVDGALCLVEAIGHGTYAFGLVTFTRVSVATPFSVSLMIRFRNAPCAEKEGKSSR